MDAGMADTVWVEPASGIVPADGALEVKVYFRPTKLVTYNVPLLVNIAQFNADALTCTITGLTPPTLRGPSSVLTSDLASTDS
eukprot:2686267-Pyramimonas_sp.AAC.2